jgi:MoaA/NifB/PqqE/SkfB family radical SAM enzyme
MIVLWRVTERCNLSCPFCAFDRELAYPRRSADIACIQSFGEILADYRRVTGRKVLVSWLGGEPLLCGPLRSVTECFHRRHGLEISTTTNGTPLADAEVRKHLAREYAELTISVDALGEIHDRLRSWPGGFAILRQSVRQLAGEIRQSGSNLRLRANVVVMRDTIGQFGALCRELAGWGIQEVTFNQLGGNDRPEFYPPNRLLPDQIDQLAEELPSLREDLKAMGLAIRGSDHYLGRLKATAYDQRMAVESCNPGERFLFIDVSGMIAPCSFTLDALGMPMQAITSSESLAGLVNHFHEEQRRRPPMACADCLSTQLFEKFCVGSA